MPRSPLAAKALRIRRFTASACALALLAASSSLPDLDLFTPAAAASPWDQLGVDIDGVAAGDRSGYSVALSDDGTRLAVGAIRDAGTQAGYVRVFEWSGSAWAQMGADLDAESLADESGYSVALSADGTRLAVGARLNSGAANYAGHVRVFQWSGSDWQQLGADVDGEAQFEQSGYSVALSDDGSRLAVGAPGGDSNRGLVRVYVWSGSEWSQLGDTISGDEASDTSGWSVALSADGGRLAVGAPGNDASASNAGRVSVFTWSGSAWTRLGSVDGEATDDFSGRAVALSANGSRLAVGAAKNEDAGADAGHVRVYSWSGSAWVQLGPDVDGEAANDQSGSSVALSADGSRLAVGASGAGPGQVRVFLWTGSAWVQVGENIDGEAADDRSGISVALAADGAAVAVGATRNDGTGHNAGHVRVHGSLTPTPVPGPPTDVAAVAGDSQVTVSWSAPLTNGGSAITAYTVTAAPGGLTCTTPGTLSCTVTGLTNGTAYTFAVTATNGDGTGPASAPPGWLTPATLPEAPTGVAASLSADTEAFVWWSAPASDGGSAVATYTVTASPGEATCATSGALSCTVTGLTIGTAYTFTVTATNGVGTGPASTASDPVAVTAPDAPSGVVASAGDSEAAVSWSTPLSDGGSAITGYTVTASSGGATCSTSGALSCLVTGLTNDVAYSFTATATNVVGTSPASAASDPVTPTAGAVAAVAPGAPTGLVATAGDSEASVSWSTPVSDGGATITAYTVTASPGGATCSTSGALSCLVTGLTNDVAYSFTATATNVAGTSAASAASDPVTPTAGAAAAVAPGAPTGLVATAGDSEAAVSWSTPVSDGGAAITAYTVTASPGGQTCSTSGALSCTVAPLTNGNTYTFTAMAANSIGLGPTSAVSNPATPNTGGTIVSGPTDVSPCPSPAVPFTDIDSVISRADIACIYGLEITTGTAARNYSPERFVDRDQMASFLARLWRAAGLECPSPAVPFTDTDSVISRADIACIYGLGITTGTSPRNYSPERFVDRDQMASFLARLWRALDDS